MSKLRAPWVATMSVAALTPCCDRDEPPQKDTSVTTAPAGMATAIATSTTAPHGFEEVPDILNPKVSGKVVVLADTHCYTYGPMAHSSGIFYERDRLP